MQKACPLAELRTETVHFVILQDSLGSIFYTLTSIIVSSNVHPIISTTSNVKRDRI
jgi:hypothetical protein